MASAIILREHGGPDALRLEQIPDPHPGPGEILIRQTAIGVNFHDCYVRSGLYRTLTLPGIPGVEGVGVVEALGPGAEGEGLAVGDRVGYVAPQYGAYASLRTLPAAQAIRLPASLDDVTAASILVKGLTVEMLVRRVHRLEPGTTVLVHAAAGGVGRLLCRWAAALGATVIGTVGSEPKREIARASGCSHVILYREQDVVAEVRRITDGRGVDVAYDSVGHDTFDGSLESLAKLGHLVNFGQSSGPVEPFAISRLAAKSNSITRPILFHWIEDAALRAEMAQNLFDAIADGTIPAEPGRVLALAEAARAHEALEARSAEGPFVLVPEPADV